MTNKNKPVSASNPPESKGEPKDQSQESVTEDKRTVMAENDDNKVATVTGPEPTKSTAKRTK